MSEFVGKYKATPPTLTDGQVSIPLMATDGSLVTSTSGGVASGSTDSGAPVKIGLKYNATPVTVTDGQRVDAQADTSGLLLVKLSIGTGATGTNGSVNGAMVDGVTNTMTGYRFVGRNEIFNGTTWDRQRKPNSTSRITSSAATTNATSAKASAGDVHFISAMNTTLAVKYLKLYNKASAPTVGTDVPVLTLAIPPSNAAWSAPIPNGGHYFSTGIAYALTGAAADADTTALSAGDVVGLNIAYS